jgi:hypothetical protein
VARLTVMSTRYRADFKKSGFVSAQPAGGTAALVAVFMCVALTGCGAGHRKAEKPPPPQDVTPGSTFAVIKAFRVPGGDTGVYFQDAHLYTDDELQPEYPFCHLTTSGAGGELGRDRTLTVTAVDYEEGGVGPGNMDVSVTDIHLRDPDAGIAFELNCMLPVLSYGARFITPAEIQGAVGGYMTLKEAP